MKTYKLIKKPQLLNEVKVIKSQDLNMSIYVDDESSKKGIWYFKVFDSIDRNSASRMNRIKFNKGEYVYHHNLEGKIRWYLNETEVEMLILLLKTKFYSEKEAYMYLNGMRSWKAGIYIFNGYHHIPYEITSQLHYYSPKYNPSYIPIDVRFPNYKKLLTEEQIP